MEMFILSHEWLPLCLTQEYIFIIMVSLLKNYVLHELWIILSLKPNTCNSTSYITYVKKLLRKMVQIDLKSWESLTLEAIIN